MFWKLVDKFYSTIWRPLFVMLVAVIVVNFVACNEQKDDTSEDLVNFVDELVTIDSITKCYYVTQPSFMKNKSEIQVVKIRDCDYVLWYYGYGSDMEHASDCRNPNCIHKNGKSN